MICFSHVMAAVVLPTLLSALLWRAPGTGPGGASHVAALAPAAPQSGPAAWWARLSRRAQVAAAACDSALRHVATLDDVVERCIMWWCLLALSWTVCKFNAGVI